MECSKVQLLIKDIVSKGEDQEERDKQVVELNDPDGLHTGGRGDATQGVN